MKLYLQNIAESIQFESLPPEWISFDLSTFSSKKTLFEYQQQALKNAFKALYKYYKDCNANKDEFYKIYKNNGFTENFDYRLNGNKKLKIFEEFDKDYKIEDNIIAFYNFINRMSFWMATGSGKTLVIVKLLELLGSLIKKKGIPENDILFLTYREDLIDQFKKHIDEFNSSNNEIYINLFNLKDYEQVKRENRLKFREEIDVFYYRSDLISDEHKDKIVNFRNYDNFGKWYVLLDEAHKGDKEDSKRQWYYSILSRNGFMFNFSATFTDPIDFATCVFNFNLEKFITQGYGKHIYISQSNIEALNQNNELTESQKQIIIIKIFLLHTIIAKSKQEKYYHKPLILTLVNSVNTEDSDLELFFREIAKVASEGIAEKILQQAKSELRQDLQHTCEFDNEKIEINNIDIIQETDILEYVFNSKAKGKIEVLKIPGNKQELVFKLATSDKPFGLIKIGDISEWIKNKLSNYQIIEKFENESVFRNLNQNDSDITLLMGSRAFYEGWDSNRPNLILYINIGKGVEARKFVLQSLGRGVRIEPLPNKRKRLQFLYNNNEINKTDYEAIKDRIKQIETLFVYGTKAENLKEVIETLKQEKQEELLGDLFEVNPDIENKMLLIPVYKQSDKILVDENYTIKFEINGDDLELTKGYFNYIGEKVALVKYDCQPKVLNKVKESFLNTSNYFIENKNILALNKPDLFINQIFHHFSLRSKEFHSFKELENEIIHFKQIKITKEKADEIEKIIKKVKEFPEKEKKEEELDNKIKNQEITLDQYKRELRNLDDLYPKEVSKGNITIKYIAKHYYIPLAFSGDEIINYITHIIKTKSEVNFINQLEKYLEKENNFFKQFEWWFFSKIDETLDEVYIPYYQPKTNRIEKFKPDFIFWLKKDNNYTILFIDPKGTEHADGYRKIDGYSRIFEGQCFKYNENNEFGINVKLFLKADDVALVEENYRQYWFDNFDDFAKKIRTPALTEKMI